MKAKQWFYRSRKRKDPIDRFSDLWRSFNNLYADMDGATERDRISDFLTKNISEGSASRVLSEGRKSVEALIQEPIVDMRGNGRSTAGQIANFTSADCNLDRLMSLLQMVYQVRCNLEHGQKSPTRPRDVELCRASSEIMQSILSLYFE